MIYYSIRSVTLDNKETTTRNEHVVLKAYLTFQENSNTTPRTHSPILYYLLATSRRLSREKNILNLWSLE